MQDNPYGLESLWLQGDFVIRGVAILLLLLSIASWYVIVTKALQLLRYRRASAVAAASSGMPATCRKAWRRWAATIPMPTWPRPA